MQRIEHGFTLLEILLVVLIVGILISLASYAGINEVRKSKLQAATSKMLELAEQARNDSLKTSVSQTIEWTENTFKVSNHPAYTLDGVKIVTQPVKLNYLAPYGDFVRPQWMIDQDWHLEVQDASGTYKTRVDFFGVTGKVRTGDIERVN